MTFATTSPRPSIELNGGKTTVSLIAFHTVASLSYKSIGAKVIPLAVASKAMRKLSSYLLPRNPYS